MGSNVGLLTETQTQTSKQVGMPTRYSLETEVPVECPKQSPDPYNDPRAQASIVARGRSDGMPAGGNTSNRWSCEVSLTETPQRPADMRAAASCCTLVHNFLPTQQAGR